MKNGPPDPQKEDQTGRSKFKLTGLGYLNMPGHISSFLIFRELLDFERIDRSTSTTINFERQADLPFFHRKIRKLSQHALHVLFRKGGHEFNNCPYASAA